ncbi:unnamed protein product [Cladocopium goreaui]|uniref:FCP1 homology domain-containing protein n=1 Tax=Cladocopium goreaui TaxID=2562237 RepID=A0A9P1CJB1_9DINO|nr:unnamed protein product [Cladocopium goreaui]
MDSRKLIFLDVDGVLATSRQILELDDAGLVPLDASCVQNLAEVVRDTGAEIVVSSAWRNDGQLYQHLLSSLEVLGGRDLAMAVVGTTPTLHQGRGFEIVQWMAEQQVPESTRLVIFEDSLQHHHNIEAAGLGAALVKTVLDPNLEEGLTKGAAEQAMRLLGAK